jgi:hypothetical protein
MMPGAPPCVLGIQNFADVGTGSTCPRGAFLWAGHEYTGVEPSPTPAATSSPRRAAVTDTLPSTLLGTTVAFVASLVLRSLA